jgi:DNA-binding winged helix-turn-helix (wHTH) protein/TolB-like protein/lipopolysaccharide biosynthesis regulator YciM
MVSRQQEEFRVGRWYVAPLSGTIATLQGKPRHLQPKVMDLLVCLAERAGEPMGRDELIHCIWGERGASDEVLTRTVSELRRALDDQRDHPEHIETIPKRGYRLISEVRFSDEAPPALAPAPRTSRITLMLMAISGAIAVLWLSVDLSQSPGPVEVPLATDVPDRSIAILPFTSCEHPPTDELLAAGIANDVRVQLAQPERMRVSAQSENALKVVARASSVAFAESTLQPAQIAAELRTAYVLEGELCSHGGNLELTADLIDRNGYLVWSQRFSESSEDTNSLARSIANSIAAQFGGQQATRPLTVAKRRALDYLVIARQHRLRGDLDQAKIGIDQALLLQPDLAEAKFELALMALTTMSGIDQRAGLESAQALADEALRLAREQLRTEPLSFRTNLFIGEVLSALGRWETDIVWRDAASGEQVLDRFEEAERHLRAAIDTNPSSSYAAQLLADALERQDQSGEAISVLERAQVLDPFNIELNSRIAKRWAERGRYRDAIRLLQRFEALPQVPVEAWWLQLELMQTHTYWDEKTDLLIRLLEQRPDVFDDHPGMQLHAFSLAADFAYLGLYDEAEAWYEYLTEMPLPDWARLIGERFYLWATDQLDVLITRTRNRLATMSDEEIYDAWYQLGMNWAWDLALDGDLERAILLLERTRYAPVLHQERETLSSILLAILYQKTGRQAEAEPIITKTIDLLEADVAAGIVHPESLQRLSNAYALQGRREASFQAFQLAVDHHWYIPWWKLPYRTTLVGLQNDPRTAELQSRVEKDLARQAMRIELMLADRDLALLLAPLKH